MLMLKVHTTLDKMQKSPLVLSINHHNAAMVRDVHHTVLPSSPEIYTNLQQNWVLNLCTWELVSPCGAVVSLTHNELRFLKVLTQTPSQPIDRDYILSEIFNRRDIYTNRSLDSLIRRLRLKIQKAANITSTPIKTAHSIGYAFSAPLLII